MAVVKANAYGHGMLQIARLALDSGADWLGVFSVDEALVIREAGINVPILVLGPTPGPQVSKATASDIRLTVSSLAAARRVVDNSAGDAIVHLKIETGTNRQGLGEEDLLLTCELLQSAGAKIEGAYTHFADIEDTTDHRFAEEQLSRFKNRLAVLRDSGITIPLPHAACSAAAILFPDTYFNLVRVGISLYGLWPSKETLVSARSLGRHLGDLRPVLTWKTRITELKTIQSGEYVGYGRTFRATRATRLAILPVGYADGYDRRLSNAAHVLLKGMRAPVRGRICMNLTMVDVTDIPNVEVGDEVVLLGRQGQEEVTAEALAAHAGTINYEIVTRAAPFAPRVVV
jgi:alanine racemase